MRVVDADAPEAALAWCTAHGLAAKNHGDDGLWLPDVAQVRNPRLVTALRAAVERLGGCDPRAQRGHRRADPRRPRTASPWCSATAC
jgi:hypothetical protein